MAQVTSAQRAGIIEAITEGGDDIARARAGEHVPNGYMNFELALQILGEARGRFLGDNWPQDSIQAAKELQATRIALQNLNAGIDSGTFRCSSGGTTGIGRAATRFR
jgi:hypothetical protein